MAKIVILNGSPRRKGNTSALVKAFTEGAESSGHTVTVSFLKGRPELQEAYDLGRSLSST